MSRLAELHKEYLDTFPHGAAEQRRALAAYRRARKTRMGAEERLEKAKQLEYKASENMVRTFGDQPIVFDGESYDAACKGHTVFLIRRKR